MKMQHKRAAFLLTSFSKKVQQFFVDDTVLKYGTEKKTAAF